MLFDGLAGGQSVTFTVKAINAVGQSVASAPSNAVVPTAARHHRRRRRLGVNSSGDLYKYANDGAGHLVYPPVRIGGGWSGYVLLSPQDFTGDGNADLIARKSNGDLMLYRGNSTGGLLYLPVRLGGGWNVMNALFTPGDFTGDGRPGHPRAQDQRRPDALPRQRRRQPGLPAHEDRRRLGDHERLCRSR